MKKLPDFSFENLYWQKGHTVIGIDEVGRGAFAGPLVVAGVAFANIKKDIEFLSSIGINDSKKLSPKKRENLSEIIKDKAISFHISHINVLKINSIGIGKSTFLGMKEVADVISKKISKPFLLIDAFEIPNSLHLQKGIIKGDTLSVSIAAASIIAKVTRDKLMIELSKNFPLYGFEKHKGYGTLFHRNLISKFGISEHHRLEFCKKTMGLGLLKKNSN